MAKIGEIKEQAQVVATCGLKHEWDAETYLRYDGMVRRQGVRPHPKWTKVVTPERCPQCGHRWMGLHTRNRADAKCPNSSI